MGLHLRDVASSLTRCETLITCKFSIARNFIQITFYIKCTHRSEQQRHFVEEKYIAILFIWF